MFSITFIEIIPRRGSLLIALILQSALFPVREYLLNSFFDIEIP